jgi:hypothetical protein
VEKVCYSALCGFDKRGRGSREAVSDAWQRVELMVHLVMAKPVGKTVRFAGRHVIVIASMHQHSRWKGGIDVPRRTVLAKPFEIVRQRVPRDLWKPVSLLPAIQIEE